MSRSKVKSLEIRIKKKKLFRLLGLLGQEHNIMVYIRSSSAHITRFKELAGKMIPMDNRTR
jgi:hypothetical protein